MTENEKYAEMRKHYCETCPIGFDRCSATKPQNCPLINLDNEHEIAVAIAHLKVGNISRIHIDMAIQSLENHVKIKEILHKRDIAFDGQEFGATYCDLCNIVDEIKEIVGYDGE